MSLLCRVVTSGNSVEYMIEKFVDGKYIGKISDRLYDELDEVIKSDRNYGLLRPRNGRSYSYKILNNDREITVSQVRKAVGSALFRWYLEVNMRFHRARTGEIPDITISFRSENEDKILTSNTLAYMYYPLGGEFDGVCVINKRFHWTRHGNGIDMHYIDPDNYPELGSGVIGKTWDLDVVLTHEFGHGIFGLPHYKDMMFPNYNSELEQLGESDILRASAKVGKKSMARRKYERLKAWLLGSSDRT